MALPVGYMDVLSPAVPIKRDVFPLLEFDQKFFDGR
jgi:hypothetical protein